MPSWTHLVRFVAVEDGATHIGQLVDTSGDVGLHSVEGKPIKAYRINGTIYNGQVTGQQLTVQKLLSPVSKEDCNYVRCLGLNYLDHAKEANMPIPKAPILFTKPRTSLTHPHPTTITIPRCAQDGTSDYEAELCVVIGLPGRDIPESEALEHVLGYTASNDVSARTLQMTTTQWSFSKGLDGSCPIGPVLVSPRSIGDVQALSIKGVLNGKVVQDGCTKDMIFTVKQQIAYFSQGTTLEVGTIILTGTPAGIGYFREPRICLKDGDDVRVHIERIGTLVNLVKYDKA